jgi:diguanylate cyclase (GGDEF)-like protein
VGREGRAEQYGGAHERRLKSAVRGPSSCSAHHGSNIVKTAPLPEHESRRLRALRRTELLDTPPSPEFDDATKLAAYICGTPIALISLVDEKRQWFKSRVGLAAAETPRDVAFCAHAILGEDVFVVPDALADERFADNPLVASGPKVRFYAGAPLMTPDGDALGTLCVVDHQPREMSSEQRAALSALARQVMAQVQLVQRTSDLVHHVDEMGLVNELGELLQTCRTMDETSEVLTLYARRLFTWGTGMVAVTNASRNYVETLARWGVETPSDPNFAPDGCWALRRGRAHSVSSKVGGVRCGHAQHGTDVDQICVPMMAQGEMLGILHVATRPGDTLSEARIQLALTTAERTALALANTQLREKLRSQSIRDPLTGLFNRRYLEESLEREVTRCTRHQRPLTALVIDVDHFKRFNDECGHAAGDAVLQMLGRSLSEWCRHEDIACRYGGEEFVVILPDGDVEGCVERAQELCNRVRSMVVAHRGSSLRPVTISVGVACLGRDGLTAEEIVAAADRALYRAKQEGRDRVVESASKPVRLVA